MQVPRAHLAEVIAKRTMHESDLNKLAKEIAAYLLLENRVRELESLIRDVLAYRQARGIIEANVVSAHELSSSVDKEIKAILHDKYPTAKSITVDNTLEPELIGGVKVDLANEQLDLSVRARLDTFKRLTSEGIH